MKKALKIILIVVVILAVLTGIFALLWFLTPIFNFLKPASDNFSIQAKKLFGGKEMSYSEYLESIEPLKVENKSYTSETNISANVSVPNSIVDYATQRTINTSKLNCKTSYDADSKAVQTSIKLTSNADEIINLNAVKDGKKYILDSKDMNSKAIVLDMDKIKEFCKANNISVSDAEIEEMTKSFDSVNNQENQNLMYDLMYLTEDEYKALDKDFEDIFKKVFDEDCYGTRKNQKISVGGEEVKATGYTLTIKGSDLGNYIKKLAQESKSNESLKSVLVKKINLMKKYSKSISSAKSNKKSAYTATSYPLTDSSALDSLTEDEDITNSDIEKMFDEIISSIDESAEDFSEIKGSVRFVIYANKKGNPVRFDVEVLKDSEDDGKVIFSEEVEDGKKTYTIHVAAMREVLGTNKVEDIIDYGDGRYSSDYSALDDTPSSYRATKTKSSASSVDEIIIVDKYSEAKDSKNGTLSIAAKIEGEKQEIAKIDYEYVNSKSEKKLKLKLYSEQSAGFELSLSTEATGLDTDEQHMNVTIDGTIPVGYTSAKVKLNMDTTRKLGQSDIKKYDDTNSIDLFSKSSEEATNVISETITNVSNNLPSKLSKIGINVTKEEILGAFGLDDLSSVATPVA